MTHPSATPPISPAKRPSDRPSPSDCLYTILPCPSDCPTLSDPTSTYRLYDTPTCPSDHLPPSHRLYDTPTCPSDHPPPSHRLYDTPNQSISLSVTRRLSDRHYDSSARMSVIPHDSPYPRLEPIPSSREWGAITHDSPYTRFEPIPSSREWGAIPQGQEIP